MADKEPKRHDGKPIDGSSPASKAKTHRVAKHAGFNATSKRVIQHDIAGEGSPGPGAYMPASSFARPESAPRSKKSGKAAPTTLSSFRSTSAQRPPPQNDRLPGPGQYSPVRSSVEKNQTNPGSQILSKSARGKLVGTSETGKVGPGDYNSHYHRSLNESVTKSVSRMSRSNPGFGARSTRKLPHEEAIEENEKWYRNMSAANMKKMVRARAHLQTLAQMYLHILHLRMHMQQPVPLLLLLTWTCKNALQMAGPE